MNKGNSKISAILLVVIVLALAVGIWIYQKNNKATVIPQNNDGQNVNTGAETYTYTNHGFSIELPKGYEPKEEINARGTRTNIDLPESTLIYVTDVDVWEGNAQSKFQYLEDEKIGETTFKVYKNPNNDAYLIYWFKQGKVGYAFSGDVNLLKTFKFVGWPQVEGRKEDLVSFSITPGQEVSGVVQATGAIKGGYFFEAIAGVRILNENKEVLRANSIENNMRLQATTDWMIAGPVSFKTTLNFTGLPKGKAYIELQNDNPSGLSQNDKSIYIPVIIK